MYNHLFKVTILRSYATEFNGASLYFLTFITFFLAACFYLTLRRLLASTIDLCIVAM